MPPAKPTRASKYDSADFFPDASDQFEIESATEVIGADSAQLHLRKLVKKYSGDWPREISRVLVLEQNNSRSGYELKLPIHDQAPAGGTVSHADTIKYRG